HGPVLARPFCPAEYERKVPLHVTLPAAYAFPARPARLPGTEENSMATVQVRYIVRDVDAAISFYCTYLGFQEVMHPAPPFAMLSRGDLRLALSAPNSAGGGGQPMPDGTQQEPGGWNRFAIEVDDLAGTVETLKA